MSLRLIKTDVALPAGRFSYAASQPDYRITPISIAEEFSFNHAFVAAGQGVMDVPAYTYSILLQPAHLTQFDGNGRCAWHGLLERQLSIISAPQQSVATTWNSDINAIIVFLAPTFVKHLSGDHSSLEDSIGFGKYGLDDAFILTIGKAIFDYKSEWGFVDPLMAESAATMLAIHTIRQYTGQTPQTLLPAKGLSRQDIRRIDYYINERLSQPLTLAELAAVVNCSRWHFSRLFKQATNDTPHAYILRLRIERAKAYIRDGKMTLAEIAAAVGFAHQSHFTKVFRQITEVTPGQFASSRKRLQ